MRRSPGRRVCRCADIAQSHEAESSATRPKSCLRVCGAAPNKRLSRCAVQHDFVVPNAVSYDLVRLRCTVARDAAQAHVAERHQLHTTFSACRLRSGASTDPWMYPFTRRNVSVQPKACQRWLCHRCRGAEQQRSERVTTLDDPIDLFSQSSNNAPGEVEHDGGNTSGSEKVCTILLAHGDAFGWIG